MPTHISPRHVTEPRAGRPLLDAVPLAVHPVERLGSADENGAGKPTLLRSLARPKPPDEGRTVLTDDGGAGCPGRTPGLPPDRTVQDAVDTALAELRESERRLRSLEAVLGDAPTVHLDGHRAPLARFELRGGYAAEDRTARAPRGRGLACLIAAEPEALLLDEPTNHLAAPDWPADWPGALAVIPHDRLRCRPFAGRPYEIRRDRPALFACRNRRRGPARPGRHPQCHTRHVQGRRFTLAAWHGPDASSCSATASPWGTSTTPSTSASPTTPSP
ncbi:hypothetical protein [Streptomyces sp. WZ-12]|uniref:hypothetical protein n=1 Tax=Streptomyces sp. WZ-12 TaxID=3030210 RepID=UPI002380F864|nr:hypothetical protein [Streptomyces sp. WZ-12]